MHRAIVPFVPFLLLTACADPVTAPVADLSPAIFAASGSPFLHRVTVGGPDLLCPGCDADLALVAQQRADGSVTGQLSDVWGGQGERKEAVHADVTCLLVVPVPNTNVLQAWIGGVVTHPASLAGHPFLMRARDRGTSANDSPDVLSSVLVDPIEHGLSSANCQDHPLMGLAFVAQGQVRVE